jgi:hypothetical protein
VALEVSAEEEHIAIANLIGDLLNAIPAFRKPRSGEADSFV